ARGMTICGARRGPGMLLAEALLAARGAGHWAPGARVSLYILFLFFAAAAREREGGGLARVLHPTSI
ncbi:hypothetical protein A2U01_0065179, partial [Trifolium medium]|nr:hypothetical protein [Trifolium medium]